MTRKKFQNGKCFFVMPTQKEWIPVFRINLASLRNEKKVFEILGFFFKCMSGFFAMKRMN
jgi:hypothetical protein